MLEDRMIWYTLIDLCRWLSARRGCDSGSSRNEPGPLLVHVSRRFDSEQLMPDLSQFHIPIGRLLRHCIGSHTGMVKLVLWCFISGGTVSMSGAAEQHLMQPRVPADKLAQARALTSPVADSPEVSAKGKALYEGKGTCVNCHGQSGAGNGPVSASLDPVPRNFQQHGFWRHRTEGEIFWVIKYGVPGTAMIGFGEQLSDEEIWTIIQYEHSFAGGHHRRGMRSHPGMGGMKSEGQGCCAEEERTP